MRALVLLPLLAVAACTQFPELDATATPGVAETPYPDLLPLERLQARAERLRAPVIDPRTRDRMDRGVADL